MLTAEGIIGPAQRGQWDAVALWDDDDIYLPWHLSAAAAALATGDPSAKPSRVWSLYGTQVPFQEPAVGRFHSSLMVTLQRLRRSVAGCKIAVQISIGSRLRPAGQQLTRCHTLRTASRATFPLAINRGSALPGADEQPRQRGLVRASFQG